MKVEIEQTSKRTKKLRLGGVGLFVLAITVGIAFRDEYGVSEGWPTLLAFGLGGGGVLLYAIGTAVAWWDHG